MNTGNEEVNSSALFPRGEVVGGKYRIEGVLGQGGMGIVYAAHHEMLAQAVALKVLRRDVVSSPDAITRFINEARAAARIRSEHVARVMDVGVLEEQGVPYMVMERLKGSDLSEILQASAEHLPIHATIDWVLQALDGLAEAHALGIIHRDLKPANIFLAEMGDGAEVVKVLDFGISKATDGFSSMPGNAAATSTKSILGTPAYMSPEQLKSSKSVDERSDIWSVGVLLFELLTKTMPFEGETVGELFAAVIEGDIPTVSSRRQDAPSKLDEVISICLQRKKDHRYPNVLALATELAPFGTERSAFALANMQRHSRRLGVNTRGNESLLPRSLPAGSRPTKPSRTSPSSPATVDTYPFVNAKTLQSDSNLLASTAQTGPRQMASSTGGFTNTPAVGTTPAATLPPPGAKRFVILVGVLSIGVIAGGGGIGWRVLSSHASTDAPAGTSAPPKVEPRVEASVSAPTVAPPDSAPTTVLLPLTSSAPAVSVAPTPSPPANHWRPSPPVARPAPPPPSASAPKPAVPVVEPTPHPVAPVVPTGPKHRPDESNPFAH